jgi:CRP/FNR family transcriptional regulator, cyclic AMP receptor protein
MMVISYDDLRQLYFQNPQFGLYLLRLISERLFRNVADAEARAKAAQQTKPIETPIVEPSQAAKLPSTV